MSMYLDIERFANRNPADEPRGLIGDLLIGEGKYKFVKKGTYKHSGAPAADKFLKEGTTFSNDSFLDDVRAAEAALPYIAGFHKYAESTAYREIISIKINIPVVWTQLDGQLVGQKML